jgi:hypothetical protein
MNEQTFETNRTRLDSGDAVDKLIFQFPVVRIACSDNPSDAILTDKYAADTKPTLRDDRDQCINNNNNTKILFECADSATDCSNSCSSEDTFIDDPNYDSSDLLLQYGVDDDEDNDVESHDCMDSYELDFEDDDDDIHVTDNNTKGEVNEAGAGRLVEDYSTSSLDLFHDESLRLALSSSTISYDSSHSESGGGSRKISLDVDNDKEGDSQWDDRIYHSTALLPSVRTVDNTKILNDHDDDVVDDLTPFILNMIASRMERTNRFLQHQNMLSSRGSFSPSDTSNNRTTMRQRSVIRTPSPKPLRPNLKDLSKSQHRQPSLQSPGTSPRKVRSSSPQPKKVRFFDDATVREYALTVGAYSCVADTCPLQLAWEHSASKRIPLKDVLTPSSTGGGSGSTLRRLTIEERRKRIASIQGIAANDVCNVEYKNLLDMIQTTKSNLDRALIGISQGYYDEHSRNTRKSSVMDSTNAKFHDSWPSSRK